MQEKLYEILGDKTCSGCGFRDERALKIRNIRNQSDIGRGSSVSWDKYVSDPGLAREDLRVLCLNCDATRQSAGAKPEYPKKKRFPR
ncbi:MAG: hypothetical protein D9C04_00535 [Nitrosopumilus sp. B06]|nr:MAG: hypothetical protein D9C04_00535 [Nitrosopumilus sp. B06]